MTRCARHPGTETSLFCGRCETAICPRCMVMTPVGARCPDCARLRRLPTFEVSPNTLLRAIGAGLAFAVGVGAVWGFVNAMSAFGGFLYLIVLVVAGYFAGEAISRAANRKRGVALQVIAGLTVFLTWAFANATGSAVIALRVGAFDLALLTFVAAPVSGFFDLLRLLTGIAILPLLSLAVAIYLAVYRLR